MTKKGMLLCVAMVLLIGLFPDSSWGVQAKDEVLRIAMTAEMSSLDHTLYKADTDLKIIENWGEFLLNRAPNGKITPGLVTSWKVSPDGKKIECTLRKGVKFHSGDLLTAKDVEFSLARGMAKNNGVKVNFRLLDHLEIIDDDHFIFFLKAPNVGFIPYRLGNLTICSKSYYDRVGEEGFSKKPSGTGPYKVVDYRPGEYVEIERFEEYWGKKPPVKKARIYFVGEDTTRVAKLKAGEVDFIDNLPFTDVKSLEKSANFKVVRLENDFPTMSIIFGYKNPKVPWYDKRVRLAIALAIDRKSIIHNLLQDNAILLAGLAPGELGYDPDLKPYTYDPKRAKALLAEAGYPNGFNIKLPFPIGGNSPMAREVAEAIASYLEAVGIRTQLVGEEQEAMVAGRKKGWDPNAEYIVYFVAGVAGGVDPTHPIKNFFTSEGARPVFTIPEVDKIINEADITMDETKRGALIKKAVKILHEEVATVPILTSITNYAMKKNIDFNPTKNINYAYVYVKDITVK